jgi:ABC-type sugar transport system ATPase subunit
VTCLLGPSGCGKTTLMRMIAGLDRPTEGRIRIGGRDVTELPARRRDVGMVFQYPVMYPTLTVAQNVAEPMRGVPPDERARRVDEMLDALDMRDQADALIGELGSGERQKVAVGRAVARRAEVVLFDEPTTNIEVGAKLALIRAIKAVTQRLRQTIVYVTHDQTEAMTLADEIALMRDGRIVQQDAPRALYDAPRTRFAGWFLGNPGMDYLPLEERDGLLWSPLLAAPLRASAPMPAGERALGVRPEWVELGRGPAEAEVTDMVIATGGRRLLTLRCGEAELRAKVGPRDGTPVGTRVRLGVPPERAVLFAGEERVPHEVVRSQERRPA